jgi:hypothetical protein
VAYVVVTDMPSVQLAKDEVRSREVSWPCARKKNRENRYSGMIDIVLLIKGYNECKTAAQGFKIALSEAVYHQT